MFLGQNLTEPFGFAGVFYVSLAVLMAGLYFFMAANIYASSRY